jgi:hypothetical protein
VLLRHWDRSAGRRVSELETARVRDEWRTDERIAELEIDLDDSRELRGRLENKLRTKRAELARLRTEHADLLRRYATAESERASALEKRRQLAIAATPPTAPTVSALGPAMFLQADEALRNLGRNAARQQALRTVEEARRRDVEHSGAADSGEDHQGRHAASDGSATGRQSSRGADNQPALPVREHRLVPAVAAAVLPYAKPQRTASRAQGGFDFFGTQTPKALGPGTGHGDMADLADLADVVGEEALAEQEIIDLTVHDETEQLDLRDLRDLRDVRAKSS